MRKRICIVLSLVMLMSALLMPQNTFAASLPYRSISSAAEYNGLPLEKTGKYYIWISQKCDKEYNVIESSLCCSQNGKDKTILKRVFGTEGELDNTISTNGKTIYYGVSDAKGEKSKIYKTTVGGKSHKLIKTVKGGFVGYYSNKIYYTRRQGAFPYVYQYDVKTNKFKRIKKNFRVQGMCGQYMVGLEQDFDVRNSVHHVIDLKSGKITRLPKALKSTTDGKHVYYFVYNSKEYGYSLRRCSMKGKSIKKLKYYKTTDPLYLRHIYLGQTSAYFERGGKLLKYTY